MSSTTDYLIESIKAINLNNKNKPVKFPCSICNCEVKNNDKSIQCTTCELWVHIKCNGISVEEYTKRQHRNRDNPELEDGELWSCMKCVLENRSNFVPFILSSTNELININSIDSMNLLDMLPIDDIHHKALSFNQLEIDELESNIDKINCK